MTVLAVSPHLDDAAFSAGAALAALAASGHGVTVATVFTASVPSPAGFALACQTDKGIGPEVDYLALRRAEDAAACAALGAEPAWLGLAEAPHRGYGSAEALFTGVSAGDAETWRDVLGRLRALVAERRPGLVLSCQGMGGHVDHLVVAQAVAALADDVGVPVAWWRDLPYALRQPGAAPGGLDEWEAEAQDAALEAKLDACAAYVSQLGYQFGRDAPAGVTAEAAMRARLGPAVERFAGTAAALDALRAALG